MLGYIFVVKMEPKCDDKIFWWRADRRVGKFYYFGQDFWPFLMQVFNLGKILIKVERIIWNNGILYRRYKRVDTGICGP